MDKVIPLGYRLLIKPQPIEEKTKGGVILPDEAKEAALYAVTIAEVITVGAGAYDEERYPEGPWCKPGDMVQVLKTGGHRFKIDGEQYRYINEDEVLALVNDPESISI